MEHLNFFFLNLDIYDAGWVTLDLLVMLKMITSFFLLFFIFYKFFHMISSVSHHLHSTIPPNKHQKEEKNLTELRNFCNAEPNKLIIHPFLLWQSQWNECNHNTQTLGAKMLGEILWFKKKLTWFVGREVVCCLHVEFFLFCHFGQVCMQNWRWVQNTNKLVSKINKVVIMITHFFINFCWTEVIMINTTCLQVFSVSSGD